VIKPELVFGCLEAVFDRPAQHSEFLDALKLGAKEANSRTERSLYQKANGYSYDSVKIFMPAGAKKPIYAPYVEHVPLILCLPSRVSALAKGVHTMFQKPQRSPHDPEGGAMSDLT
jgi:hypothetical protein